MPHRSSILFGTIFFGGLLVIAWLEYYPSTPMFEVVGIPGPRANSGRQCGLLHEPTIVGLMPMRFLSCGGPPPSTRLQSQQFAGMDILSRRVRNAGQGWVSRDSAQWLKERDSVAASLDHLGGHQFACKNGQKWYPEPAERRYWKFPTFYVRLLAHGWESDRGLQRIIQVDGFADLPFDCVPSRRGVPPRGNPPAESSCNADALIKMPLPGNRVLCVRTSLWN